MHPIAIIKKEKVGEGRSQQPQLQVTGGVWIGEEESEGSCSLLSDTTTRDVYHDWREDREDDIKYLSIPWQRAE